MRRLLITLIVIAALLAAADFGTKEVAEGAVAGRMDDELVLTNPTVSIDEWPFLVGAMRGELSSVSISSTLAGGGRLKLRDVRLTLRDLRFSASEVVSGEMRSVRTGGGRGSATLIARDLTEALQSQGLDGRVKFENGDVVVSAPDGSGHGAAVTGMSVDGDRLILQTSEADAALVANLPGIAPGISYESIDVGNGDAVLMFVVEPGGLGL